MFSAYINAWKKAFDFKGRTTRKDYWYFQLLTGILIAIILSIYFFIITAFIYSIDNQFLYKFLDIAPIIYLLFLFGTFWVNLALTVRRIRDVGMRWYWIFFAIIPYIGSLYVLIFLTRTSVLEINDKKYFLKY